MTHIKPKYQLFVINNRETGCFAVLLSSVAVPWYDGYLIKQVNSSKTVAAFQLQFYCKFAKE